MTIDYRPACEDDAVALARLMLVASDGLLEYLLDGLHPTLNVRQMLERAVTADGSLYHWRYCQVATDGRGGPVVGHVNAFAAEQLRGQDLTFLPDWKREHVRALNETQDWGSLLVASIAVETAFRGRGIADRLLEWALDQAVGQGLPRASLQVWEDNRRAIAVYRRHGFEVVTRIALAPGESLRHEASLFMVKQLN